MRTTYCKMNFPWVVVPSTNRIRYPYTPSGSSCLSHVNGKRTSFPNRHLPVASKMSSCPFLGCSAEKVMGEFVAGLGFHFLTQSDCGFPDGTNRGISVRFGSGGYLVVFPILVEFVAHLLHQSFLETGWWTIFRRAFVRISIINQQSRIFIWNHVCRTI